MGTSLKRFALSTLVAAALTGLVCAKVNVITERGLYETTMRGVQAGQNFAPPEPEKERARIAKALNTVIATQHYSNSTLAEWLEVLADEESGNRAHIKVLDVNGRYSYGCLQFQMATWIGMGKAYGIGTTPENIYDCQLQKHLAFVMISDRYANWRHWGWTVTKVGGAGYPPQT
jgi:hypothetical protein